MEKESTQENQSEKTDQISDEQSKTRIPPPPSVKDLDLSSIENLGQKGETLTNEKPKRKK